MGLRSSDSCRIYFPSLLDCLAYSRHELVNFLIVESILHKFQIIPQTPYPLFHSMNSSLLRIILELDIFSDLYSRVVSSDQLLIGFKTRTPAQQVYRFRGVKIVL